MPGSAKANMAASTGQSRHWVQYCAGEVEMRRKRGGGRPVKTPKYCGVGGQLGTAQANAGGPKTGPATPMYYAKWGSSEKNWIIWPVLEPLGVV